MLSSAVAVPTRRLQIDSHDITLRGDSGQWLEAVLQRDDRQERLGLVQASDGLYFLGVNGQTLGPQPGNLHDACRALLIRRFPGLAPAPVSGWRELAEDVRGLVALVVLCAVVYAVTVAGGAI